MPKIELLAPGGDVDSIKAAIHAGANAVYCGLDKFNARNRAKNLSIEELIGVLNLAHKNDCQVFLTLNIIVVDQEIPALFKLLNKLVNINLDGIIVQDMGVLYIISQYFPSLNIHASTQLTTHNQGQIQFLKRLNAERVNLSRELNLKEIAQLCSFGDKNNIKTEVFIHGSYCISFSGICYMSSLLKGKSGNRGQCSQPCRDRYKTTLIGKEFPLNMKDNSAFFNVKALIEAGVYSLKVEGRIKEFEYVFTVVKSYRKQIDNILKYNKQISDNSSLYKVFNRDFSNGFLTGDIGKNLFTDNPMSYSSDHHNVKQGHITKQEQEEGLNNLYREKEELRNSIKAEIDKLSIEKQPLKIEIIARYNEPLKITLISNEQSFNVQSKTNLSDSGFEALTEKIIFSRLRIINETSFFIAQINFNFEEQKLFIPFKELAQLKNEILLILNEKPRKRHDTKPPVLINKNRIPTPPKVSILISSIKDSAIAKNTNAEIHYQIPDRIGDQSQYLFQLFKENNQLIPWFPSIIIENDYQIAVELLHKIKPTKIITNNIGIAYAASQIGIKWIAGPNLNIANSYSLIAMKELFNCSGAFLSNEINRMQMKAIKCPENFELYFNAYHPIELMTSRQCLFQQVTGCKKSSINEACISTCTKTSSITSLKNETFLLRKTKNNFNQLFASNNYLNLDPITDLYNTFSFYSFDCRPIKTSTELSISYNQLIKSAENYLKGVQEAKEIITNNISNTTKQQYIKGL